MKIRDIISEAQDREMDKRFDAWARRREEEKRRAAKSKKLADRPGMMGFLARNIKRGSEWSKKAGELATKKIPFANQ